MPQLVIATDIVQPPGVTILRNGDELVAEPGFQVALERTLDVLAASQFAVDHVLLDEAVGERRESQFARQPRRRLRGLGRELARLGGINAGLDHPQGLERACPGVVRRPGRSVHRDPQPLRGVGLAADPVLDDVDLAPGGRHDDAETADLVVP